MGTGLDSSSIAILDEEPLPKSGCPKKGNGQGARRRRGACTAPAGAIVVAYRKGSSVDLSRWSMDGGGALSLLDDKIKKMGPATTMDLQPVYADMLLTAATRSRR